MKKLFFSITFLLCTFLVYSQQDTLCWVEIYPDSSANGDLILQADAFGTAPFAYLWSTGENTNNITPSSSGTYCLTVTDSNNCVSQSCYDHNVPPPPDTLCHVNIRVDLGLGGDTILIAVPGGTSPYTYIWSNGETDAIVVPQSDGTYCVTITDATGCEATDCISIFNNNPCGASITFDGTYLYASGTNPSNSIFLWSTGDTSNYILPTTSGTYCVTVTDQTTACSATACLDYNDSPDTLCWVIIEEQMGALEAIAYGNAPFSYSWSDGSTTQTIVPPSSGWYCVTVTAATGCTATACHNFTNPIDSCDVTISVDSLITPVGCDWLLTAEGWGVGPFNYVWNTGAVNESIIVAQPGRYCVTLTDTLGCSSSACVEIDSMIFNCNVEIYQDSLNIGLFAVAWGQAPFTYSWSTGATTSSIVPTSSGWYCVTVTDANGCVASSCYSFFNPKQHGGADWAQGQSTTVDTANFTDDDVKKSKIKVGEILDDLTQQAVTQIGLYPNPAEDYISWAYKAKSPGKAILTVTNVGGRILLRQELELAGGEQSIRLDVSGLPNTLYLLNMEVADEYLYGKFVKH